MTQIITAIKAREITGLSKNVEDRKWEPFFPVANISLKNILGKDGYTALVDAIEADPTLAAEPALKALRDTYVWPYLAWRTCELAGTRMLAEPDRNGTFTRSGESYNSVDGKTLAMTKADSRDMAENWRDEMVAFIKDNPADYPWYEVNRCEEKKKFSGGVITQPSRGRRNYLNGLEGGY
jgi:hypothetical protein